ncbi:MAG: YqeG family HAD IIIA-type phosphatase [Clostridia bacterium]|nr:YqeG family HAD IIIA-type phosphatase [Clostridia bacterium]
MKKGTYGFLLPDYDFGKYGDITVEFLNGIGCRALLIDIDNTLAPYEQAEPDEAIRLWFSSLAGAGIKACLVSNNTAERVELFNKTLGLPAFPDSHKPSTEAAARAMADLGSAPEETVCLGDQLFTDVVMAHRAGLRAIKLPPIRDKKTLFFRFKRALEKPLMKKYYRLKKEKSASPDKKK